MQGADVRELKILLRQFLAKPIETKFLTSSVFTNEDQSQLENSIKELEKQIIKFPGKSAVISEKRIRTRINHTLNRLKFYSSSELSNFSEILSSIQHRCHIVEAKLIRAVNDFSRFATNPVTEQSDTGLNSESDSEQEDDLEASLIQLGDSLRGNPEVNNSRFSPQVFQRNATANVYKWGVTFTGKSDLLTFLERVEELRAARGVSYEALFRSAIDLFSDKALCWYRSNKDRVNSWQALVDLLKRDFLAGDIDDDTWEAIRTRKQERGEPVSIFASVIENMFSRLTVKPDESTRLKLIRKNLLPVFTSRLCLHDISNVDELLRLCRKIEATLSNATIKTRVNAINAIGKDEESSTNTELKRKTICWNCDEEGHRHAICKKPRKRFCFKCGVKGHIIKTCPKCSKNQ